MQLELTEPQRNQWLSQGYSWVLGPRQLCDFELLCCAAFDPLKWFMSQSDYLSVVAKMRLQSGALMPIPIVWDVDERSAETLLAAPHHGRVVLRDPQGLALGLAQVRGYYKPDRQAEAQQVYGTTDFHHPGVDWLMNNTHDCYLESDFCFLRAPVHHDFVALRRTPAQLKAYFAEHNWERRIAFQTRNPLHRAHIEMTKIAAAQSDAHLVIHPVVGMTRPGDIDHFFRVRCYQAVLKYYDQVALSLLPLAMRMAGPREALWHALIRRNYGFSHFIVGRDHAGPGSDRQGQAYYEPDAAAETVRSFEQELGIQAVTFKEVVYNATRSCYQQRDQLKAGEQVERLSGTEFRDRLQRGEAIPAWYSYPEVVEQLRLRHPPLLQQGLVIFLTGLSGAGKSTIAGVLRMQLLALQTRAVSVLDGDLIRRHLSSELGFSREHRDLNVTRVGFVASEIARHGGICLCAMIAPYAQARDQVRALVEEHGRFIEVFVDTPLDVCQQRDPKGLYRKSASGLLKGLTGVDDPYEAPLSPELRIDASVTEPAQASAQIITLLQKERRLP